MSDQTTYSNIRTRTIVIHQGCILLHPPGSDGNEDVWAPPGGGLMPYESLTACTRREVLEETGVAVRVGNVAFLLEWVYTEPGLSEGGHNYGLEVFHYAYPEEPVTEPRAENPHDAAPRWVPFASVPNLPLWPKELKDLCQRLSEGHAPEGCHLFAGEIDSPMMRTAYDPFL